MLHGGQDDGGQMLIALVNAVQVAAFSEKIVSHAFKEVLL
jgi:hypothetical protein